MYCTNCGKQMEDGARFCIHCGALAEAGTKSGMGASNTGNSNPAGQFTPWRGVEEEKLLEKDASKKTRRLLIILGIAAVVAIAAIAAVSYLLFSGKSVEEQAAEQLKLGNRYLEEMDYEQAVVAFNKTIEIDPSNVDAYLGASAAYVALENYGEAVSVLDAGYGVTEDLKIAKQGQAVCLEAAEHYIAEENYEEAEKYIEKGKEYGDSEELDQAGQKLQEIIKNHKVYSYIKETYGFADEFIHGEFTAIISREENRATADSSTKFKEESKGGAVFYKTLNQGKDSEKTVCIYLSDDKHEGYKGIRLYAAAIDGTGKLGFAAPHMKSRCYCMVKEHYLICVELAEKNEGWYGGYYYLAYQEDEESLSITSQLYYEESIKVYDIDNNWERKYEIIREIKPGRTEELKSCTVYSDDGNWAYGSGYDSYTNNSAVLLETEEEFCDKANELLSSISAGEIVLKKTSWKNRWDGLEIDESGVPGDMVKIDFSCSYGEVDSNDNVNSDIEITINAGKEKYEDDLLNDGNEQEPQTAATENDLLRRVNYYSAEGELLYYENYVYYGNGLLCSRSFYEMWSGVGDFGPHGTNRYTLVFLYDNQGNQNEEILYCTQPVFSGTDLDSLVVRFGAGIWAQKAGNQEFRPGYESIEQEKFGVDPAKTEQVFGNAAVIPMDPDGEWAGAYLNGLLENEYGESGNCEFMYVNDDDVPELFHVNGDIAELFTANEGIADIVNLQGLNAYYVERGNLVYVSGGGSDWAQSNYYQIENGRFVVVGESGYTIDRDTDAMYYTWNGEEMEAEEVARREQELLDAAGPTADSVEVYSAEQCQGILDYVRGN